MTIQFFLASQSPRRSQLLKQMGVDFKIVESTIDEIPYTDESPLGFVERMAKNKAEAGLERVSSTHKKDAFQKVAVLGADTVIVHRGRIIGKPKDREHSREILTTLSDDFHEVITAVCILVVENILQDDSVRYFSSNVTTKVYFGKLSAAEITDYWETGEPADKAGSYAIQGLAALFIKKIEGSYSSVVGLPIYETAMLLKSAGIPHFLNQ